jgi:hypothetical protein
LEEIVRLLFNISIEGSQKEKSNTRRSILDKDVETSLMEIHKSNLDNEVIQNIIPIILINIHKGEVCPPSLLPFLSTVHTLLSSSDSSSGIDYSRWARLSFEGVLNPEKSLLEHKKR